MKRQNRNKPLRVQASSQRTVEKSAKEPQKKAAKDVVSSESLTTTQSQDLLKSLNDFATWLEKKRVVDTLDHINHYVDLPFANEDWVMKVNVAEKTVSFNTLIAKRCSYEYYKCVVLHEFFHLAVQRVPNKEDAVRVKDDFGDELMKLIDIEADFFTALYFKEQLNYTLVGFLRLYFEGSQVFLDPRIRAVKFERFIGTLLSITKMFLAPKRKDNGFEFDLYLPTIRTVYTEDSLHVLVVKKEHIYFDTITASYLNFIDLKKCYSNIDSLTEKAYVRQLVEFACKALQVVIKKDVTEEIETLKS